jgi:hypothetical protein
MHGMTQTRISVSNERRDETSSRYRHKEDNKMRPVQDKDIKKTTR